jgi:polysaccharide export outer membrane protein
MVSCVPSLKRHAEGFGGREKDAVSSWQAAHLRDRAAHLIHLSRSLLFFGVVMLIVPCSSSGSQTPLQQAMQNPSNWPSSTEGAESATDKLANQLSENEVRELRESIKASQPAPKAAPSPNAVSQGPSRIERLISGRTASEASEVSADLEQFGYAVFQTPVSTFAPITNVPVGPDYVIGPGDSFTVTLWGRIDARHTLVVDRNGQVILPEVGALKVWGMKFGALESYLYNEISRKFTDFKMSVTMERLRTIQVFIVGEAATPGTYTVSSLSTVINALFAAGGPSKNGSLRKIRLLRNGAEPNQVDLYEFLLGGDRSEDVHLQNGDTVFVPLIGPVVGVAGNVKRPAIYEMIQPMNLRQVLDLAGGVTFAGWLQRVQVERVEDHQRRIVADFNLSEQADPNEQKRALETVVRDGDLVKVFSVTAAERNVVYLEGHVVRPGMYEWKPGMRLRDIIASYDVVLPQPNLMAGEIERLVPPDMHPIVIPFNLSRLLAGDDSQNIELASQDTVRVFRWDQRHIETVRISGMVYEPNEYRLTPQMRVRDLIDRAGGLRKNAYLRDAEITRYDVRQSGVTTERININLELVMSQDPEQNILLHDYDQLVVRPIPDLAFDRMAQITGEVRFPGTYPIRRDETLSSLIERAGGYTENAYLKGAVFTRKSAKEVQRRRLDQLIQRTEVSMLSGTNEAIGGALDAETAQSQQTVLAAKKELLTKLQAVEITGRVVVKLTPLDDFRNSASDIQLEDGDSLVVPQTPGVVHVVGEVFNETSLLYQKDATVGYYLRRVGGTTDEADDKQVSVIKADGSVVSKSQGGGSLVTWDSEYNQWSFGGFMGLQLDPGDTIVVPRKLDKFFWLKTTKDITQIVFQIAVAAGVVFAI